MATTEDPKQPMPPGKRRRLQMCFEQGTKVAAAGQFDYATDMYTQCVNGDPGNTIYVRSFLANLVKKYNNNKKGSAMAGLKTAGTKASIKKSVMQKDWPAVIASGLEVLKVNPWDQGGLFEIANACEQLEFDECQLEYLKLAYDADPTDVNSNRVYARALGRTGNFDEALNCWQRVLKAKPGDEEATRTMSRLSVEKTIKKGGYEDASSTKDVRASKFDAGEDEDARLTPEERLLRLIEKDPANTANYIELNEMYQRDERFDKADELLTKALAASGGDVLIRERLEDVQLRRGTQTLMIAEKKAREEKTEESVNLYRKLAADFNAKQIQIYAARCERYPTNIGFKYELATCYKKGKKFNDAIGLFQQCRSDLKRKGKVYFSLAECFYNVKQYKMALDHFEQAAKEIPEKDIEERKNAMYLAGKLAAGLKDYEAADKHFTALASLDFGYKDVGAWLDKLAKLREDGDDSAMNP